jgi:serine/threonine protein kinase
MMLGAFGNVKIGWLKADPSKVYAIKTMKKAEIIKSKHVDHIENEKKILEKLVHPFAVSSLFLTHSLLVGIRRVLLVQSVYLLCDRVIGRWGSVYSPQTCKYVLR